MVVWLPHPRDKSETQISIAAVAGHHVSRRNRTGSDSAFSVVANWMAASAESGSRTSGTNAHCCSSVTEPDFDTH